MVKSELWSSQRTSGPQPSLPTPLWPTVVTRVLTADGIHKVVELPFEDVQSVLQDLLEVGSTQGYQVELLLHSTADGRQNKLCICNHSRSDRWVRSLGPIVGSNRWVQPLGPTIGSNRWVQSLGPIIGSNPIIGPNHWVQTLGPIIGSHRWVQSLTPIIGSNRWVHSLGPLIGPSSYIHCWGSITCRRSSPSSTRCEY